MRDFINIVGIALKEGEVVDLQQRKSEKKLGDYAQAVKGVVGAERAFFDAGKFAPFAEAYIESGFNEAFVPKIWLWVEFRDSRKTPEARRVRDELKARRFEYQPPSKWDRAQKPDPTQPQQMALGGFANGEVTLNEARELFASRESSPFGAYQASRLGFRTSGKPVWDKNGIGFCLVVGGFDPRRPGERGDQWREEHHIIDDEKDMQEVVAMFAAINRAKIRAV